MNWSRPLQTLMLLSIYWLVAPFVFHSALAQDAAGPSEAATATETQAPSPEITAALRPLRDLEAGAAATRQKRLDRYLADLEALEKTVATETGDLEQVIVVRREKEARARGESADPIDPKDESKPLALRKLRYYFDRDLAKLDRQSAAALAKAREETVARLKALEARFTQEKKIELAVAARRTALELQGRGTTDGGAMEPITFQSPRPVRDLSEKNLSSPKFGDAFVNGAGMIFMGIEPGSFMMGDPDSPDPWKRAHEVTLTNGFWIGKHEVTRSQFQEVTGRMHRRGNLNEEPKGGDLPVRGFVMGWAENFLLTLNKKEQSSGRLPKGWSYAFPSEAQWEYAARAGSEEQAYGEWDEIAWVVGSIQPVGTKKPNAWGVHDMLGNVGEFTSSAWTKYPADPVVNPLGGRYPALGYRGDAWELYARRGMGRKVFERTTVAKSFGGGGGDGIRLALIREETLAPPLEELAFEVVGACKRRNWRAALKAVEEKENLVKELRIDDLNPEIDFLKHLVKLQETLGMLSTVYPPDLKSIGNHRYLFVPIPMQWPRAQEFAKLLDGNLVVVSSGEELKILAVEFGHLDAAWIGLEDSDHDQKWEWVNDETGEDVKGWARGFPRRKVPDMVGGYYAAWDFQQKGWTDLYRYKKGRTRSLPFILEWENPQLRKRN